ncbi:MAG: heme-dependent oxidative N-demethylase family protein [Geminicoccaceae bacterium]
MMLYRPFMKPAARHAMAIKALDPGDWLEFGGDFQHQMRVRRQLLDQRPGDVLATLPGSEAGQAELLALLLDHLERHAGDRYVIEPGLVVERGTGLRMPAAGAPALDLIGRLAQEDFCLLQQRDGRYRLTAAVLCFPAHWSLAEKLGRPLIDIHEPVPGFADQLGNPVERLFEKLDPEKPVQRLNWSLVDTDELFLPPSHRSEPVELDVDEVGERIRLRVERQTLRRLPVSGDVVFGIRTYVTPLSKAIDGPEAATALLARLDDLSAPMQVYKNLVDVKPALISYLEARQG